MRPRDRIVVTGVVSVLFLMWLGFLVHRSPRYPGSGGGAVFGIAGAVLLLFPLIYPIAKRIPFIHSRITSRIPLKTLLAVHVYTGILGPLLAIIHTGHKFTSLLGRVRLFCGDGIRRDVDHLTRRRWPFDTGSGSGSSPSA